MVGAHGQKRSPPSTVPRNVVLPLLHRRCAEPNRLRRRRASVQRAKSAISCMTPVAQAQATEVPHRSVPVDHDLARVGVAARDPDVGSLAAPAASVIIAAGLLLTAAIVLAQAASQWIDLRFFNLSMRALDSNYHLSVFGAASLLAQAGAAAAIAARAASSDRRLQWLIVAGFVGVLLVVRAFMYDQTTMTMLLAPLAAVFIWLSWLTFSDPPACGLWSGDRCSSFHSRSRCTW